MRQSERGFSLVELIIAMTVTLIVSGAIYGLLASGGNAFRREPEVADRQQNIRIAMDLVARDVFNAGAGLPTFAQAFTRTDPTGGACAGTDGVNGCGVMGTMGTGAADARAPGDGKDPLENTDVLEIVTTDEECPIQSVCPVGGTVGTLGPVVTREGVPGCMRLPTLALLADDNAFVVRSAQAGGASVCDDGGTALNGRLTLSALPDPFRPATVSGAAIYLYAARVARYRIAPSSDPTDTAPALWRSATGRYSATGAVVAEPSEGGFPDAGSPWELVARGIEDLQIEYKAGDGVWHNLPPTATANDWDALVRQVRITLSARASAANVQGQNTQGGTGPEALRGELSTTVTPRAAFNELQMGGKIQ
jgi:prepilin-type N-terminal cleavage/methylation domain-containing protein